jgi:hypothetical protein
MLDNIKPAKLTKLGTLTITSSEVMCDDFEGNAECSCRDVAALALVWAIGKLQRELAATLRQPGGTGKMSVG